MATFAIDVIDGKEYLFIGNFGSTTGGTQPTLYPAVNTYSDLPNPADSEGYVYLVRTSTGEYLQDRKESGLYFSTGSTWRRLGDIPSFFSSDNFEIYDSDDNTKGVKFVTSGITSGVYSFIEYQDKDGVVAYLSDVGLKLDTSIFNTYTGRTSLILVDEIGGVNVNTIEPTPIDWSSEQFSGTSLSYTGGSKIFVEEDGMYELSYNLNLNSDAANSVNLSAGIRINNIIIDETTSTCMILNPNNDSGTITLPSYNMNLISGDYIDLVCFRVGNDGLVYTVENSSWIKIKKKYNN